jgi:hypothetical protein
MDKTLQAIPGVLWIKMTATTRTRAIESRTVWKEKALYIKHEQLNHYEYSLQGIGSLQKISGNIASRSEVFECRRQEINVRFLIS